jgi:asparagine synthase (glutamine-hydrolysing)
LHLYALSSGIPEISERRLAAALAAMGREFTLDPQTAWAVTSDEGALVAAGLHHSPERCGPRRYIDRRPSVVTWFDGLPVESSGRFSGCDARALAGHWGELSESLEGQFSAVRLDLREQRAEVLLDPLGHGQVFVGRRGRGVLLSNSATVIMNLLGLDRPDPLGISSFIALGWAAGGRTLAQDVRVLEGGAVHTVEPSHLRTRHHFDPAIARRGADRPREQFAAQMKGMTENAIQGMSKVECALTGGRDSRVVAALLVASGHPARYFTGGIETDPDVLIACELAEKLELEHEVVCHDPEDASVDWTEAASHFLQQSDGLTSLQQLPDYTDFSLHHGPLGVKLSGVGGEIGRSGTDELQATATNVPLLRSSVHVQDRLLALKARDESGLMTPDAAAELASYLHRFRSERLEEGWRAREMQEAFYMFERVGRWAATGSRRVAGMDDTFAPFCTRPFIDYCFSLSSRERYAEVPHYLLLSELLPTVRDHRYDTPFPKPRPWLASASASRQLARAVRKQLLPRRSAGASAVSSPEYPFQHTWLESRTEMLRELFSNADSALWELISRPRIEALLNGSEEERARNQEGLLRATTLFWYFHGPEPSFPVTPTARRVSSPGRELHPRTTTHRAARGSRQSGVRG